MSHSKFSRPQEIAVTMLIMLVFTAMLLYGTSLTSPSRRGGDVVYRPGYSVQGSWLCFGWSSGAYHCTQHWARIGGVYVSFNRGWVPSQGNPVTVTPVKSVPTSPAGGLPARTHVSQWAATGYGAFTAHWGAAKGYAFGNCTAGAAALAPDIPSGLHNAGDWARTASAHGLPTGTAPRLNATAVFAPGVQGASRLGHVAHVVGVYSGGWFLVEEENFFWNGGGFNRVDYRYAHAGPGVRFIY